MLSAERIQQAAREIGVTLSHDQGAAFARYAQLLVDWNTRLNLTAIIDDEGVLGRHFMDSLTVLRALPPAAANVLDVGTGAGFPGIALKIARPELKITLMDSTGKKLAFCDAVITQLGLANITTLNARADDIAHAPAHRERYDAVTARAVAGMNTLAEYLLPLCRVGGVCIAMKGLDAATELAAARGAIPQLGGRVNRIEPVQLPGLPDARALIVLDKVAPTPAKFPRSGGLPRSKPLQ